ncbi:MAG: glycosyltransferase family 39 protein, partial [Dactylosporangium sp.]|nr:glycosyltransferase family 39 protein [Dactylosporangium sp.]
MAGGYRPMKHFARRVVTMVPTAGWLMAAALYALTVALTVLQFRQWGPDARYYLGWAYRYGGLSEAEAGRRTYEFLGSFSWFAPFCHGACGSNVPPSAYDQLFHGVTGGLVAPRVLYPLLSAPFVRMFGPWGMLVVPVVAYAVCLVLVMLLAARLVGPRWAVLAAAGVLLPMTVSRWSTYAYTEALSMALFMACVVVLPLARRAGRRDLVLFGVFLALFAFTRQFHPVVVGAVALAWLGAAVRRRRVVNEWLPFTGVAVGVTLAASWLHSLMGPEYSIVES